MYTIFKSFNIAYGHSVWKQRLNENLSEDCRLACRYQHGHNADITIFVESEDLDDKGMVLDFKELGFAKQFLDNVVDHKMIIDIDDPMLTKFYPILSTLDVETDESIGRHLNYHEVGSYFTIWPDIYGNLSNREIEIYSGIIIVQFIPTAENLAKWVFEYVQGILKEFAIVKKVQVWETPKACAEYSI